MSSIKEIQDLRTRLTVAEERIAALEAVVASVSAKPVKAVKQPKTKVAAENKEGVTREPSAALSAWKTTVYKTVADMRVNGWEGWTDVSGNSFAGSKPATIDGRATHVFTDSGKEPVYPNGLKRASYLKIKDSPEEIAKTKARAEKRATVVAAKKSKAAKPEEAIAEVVAEVVAEAVAELVKPKRVVSDEQKAKMQAGRLAAKAAKAAAKVEEIKTEVETDVKVDVAEVKAVANPKAKAAAKVVVPAKVKVLDLNFNPWCYQGDDYISNERGDVLTMEGDWVGRFDGKVIDEQFARPADIDEYLSME